MPKKKRGRPINPNKLDKTSCTLYLEEFIIKFVREEIEGLNISKVAIDAVITQIIYTCMYMIRRAEIDGKEKEVFEWRNKLFRFEEYLRKRARKIAKNGKDAEIQANYDLARYLLIKNGISEQTF